ARWGVLDRDDPGDREQLSDARQATLEEPYAERVADVVVVEQFVEFGQPLVETVQAPFDRDLTEFADLGTEPNQHLRWIGRARTRRPAERLVERFQQSRHA